MARRKKSQPKGERRRGGYKERREIERRRKKREDFLFAAQWHSAFVHSATVAGNETRAKYVDKQTLVRVEGWRMSPPLFRRYCLKQFINTAPSLSLLTVTLSPISVDHEEESAHCGCVN